MYARNIWIIYCDESIFLIWYKNIGGCRSAAAAAYGSQLPNTRINFKLLTYTNLLNWWSKIENKGNMAYKGKKYSLWKGYNLYTSRSETILGLTKSI
jgi:hypothetical protein